MYYSSGVAVDEDAMAGSAMEFCAARDCFFGFGGGYPEAFLVGDSRPRERSVLYAVSECWATVFAEGE
jgi:hypothetical protein